MTVGCDGGVNNNGVRVKAAGCGPTKKNKKKNKTDRQEGETGGKLRKKRSTLGEELTKAVRGVGPGRLRGGERRRWEEEQEKRDDDDAGPSSTNIVIVFFFFFLNQLSFFAKSGLAGRGLGRPVGPFWEVQKQKPPSRAIRCQHAFLGYFIW